jgi:hypothetical protein
MVLLMSSKVTLKAPAFRGRSPVDLGGRRQALDENLLQHRAGIGLRISWSAAAVSAA